MPLVVDANTLIYLAKADLLGVLEPHEVWVGDHVYEEAVERGKDAGKTDAYLLERRVDDQFERKSVDEDQFEQEMEYFGAAGETDAYLLADGASGAEVVTTDATARRKLKRRGIDVVRTDMLLYREFEQGRMTAEELNTALIDLRSVGGTTDERINFLMEQARNGGENHEQDDQHQSA